MSVNIKAPNLRAPRVSILTAADLIALEGDKWWGGIEYKKLSGNPAQGIDSEWEDDDSFLLPICPVDSTAKSSYPRSPTDRVQPFVVYATEECSTYGDRDEILDRAKQKLLVGEAWSIEHELWFGTGTNNDSFADGSVSVGTGLHPLLGFTAVDSAVARDRADGRGMVHLTVRTFDLLQQYNLFRREGNVWLSPNDNIVVPGRGYGEGEDEIDSIYGHPGIIQIARSDVFTFPESADSPSFVNRSTNDLWAVAERVVTYIIPSSVGTDGATGVYSATVDTELALSSGGGGGGGDATAANQSTAIGHLVTLLGQTDTLEANSDTIEALLSALGGNTDGIEALLTTANGLLTTANGLQVASTATLSNVNDQDTTIQLLAAAAGRLGVVVVNDSPGVLYIKYGTTASVTDYTYKVAAGGTWEMPAPLYRGRIDGIWTSSASGAARITELT